MQISHSAIETRLEIQKLNALPPTPLVAQELLVVMADNDADLNKISTVIERDPALVARIIGVANSAYFGFPERVTTVHEAIFQVLGLNTARSLALSMVLSGPFETSHCPTFHLDDYWAEAMLAATLAQRLARYVRVTPRPHSGDAYLAGLLHDLGLLALVHIYPEEMGGVFTAAGDSDASLLMRERERLGADHLQVGGWLARKWHLPPNIVAVMERYADADAYEGDGRPLVQLVGYCARWATACRDSEREVDVTPLAELGIDAADAERVLGDLLQQQDEIAALAQMLVNH